MVHIPVPTYEQLKKKVQRLEKEALRRKQADEVLRKSEERYRMIFNYSPLGIVHFDSNGEILDCNECFLEIIGAPKDKLIGFSMTESLRDEQMRSAAIAGLSGKPNYFEGDYRSVAGNKVTPIRAMFSRITTDDGRFLGGVGLFEDITERKMSEEYLWKIANSINDPIFVKDRQHRHVLVNDAQCRLAGRERINLIGRTDYDLFPKEQVDIFWEKDEIVFETGDENENEEEITDAQGRTRTIVTKKSLYTDKAGDKFIVGVIRDITERKEAELALQAAHQKLQDIIEFLPDATFVIDRDKKILFWNRAMEEMTGIKKQDIIGQGDYAYAIPFYGERRPLLIDIVMAENPEIEKRYDYVQRKGMTLCGEAFVAGTYQGKGAYLWSTAAPLLTGDGSITGVIQSIRDISGRKHAEEALRQSEEKYRQLFETVADAILVFDSETRKFVDVNEKACLLYGYSREEFIKLTHSDITAEVDGSIASVKDTLAGTYTQIPFRYHKKRDGTLFPAEISSSTFVLGGRRVICGVVRDITDRMHAEEAIRQQFNFQQTLIDTIPSPVFYKDIEGRYLGCNSSFESYIGMSKADVIGKTVYEIAPGDLAEIYRQADRALFEEPGAQQYETMVQYADGARHDVLFTKGTFSDLEGKVAGLVGVMLDITERKMAERELSRYRYHLEDLIRERTEELAKSNERLILEINERRRAEEALKMFAYSIAHDLKSPSIGIHGLTKRLHRLYGHVLDEKGRTYCDQILKVSEHIAALVEQVNVFIVTKEATPLFEEIKIKDVLRMLEKEFSAKLSIRRIELIEPQTAVEIKADRLCLLRIFRNLVDNALKYGGERLSKIWIGYEETADFHMFSVADDGKGLKGADPEKIFKMFHRESTSKEIEGAGLGLAIVKEIAEKHGGTVWIEAGDKNGITFYISFSKYL